MRKKILISIMALMVCVTSLVLLKETKIKKQKNETKQEIALEEQEVSDYEIGFSNGYDAFKRQVGIEENQETFKKARYAVQRNLDEEKVSKGYVDGYHRAADEIYCPRGK